MFENIFETANSGFAQALYEEFLRDPSSVPEEWRLLFESGVVGEQPSTPTVPSAPAPTAPSAQSGPAAQPESVRSTEAIRGPALRLLQNMEDSLDIPTATSLRDLEVSALWAYRAALNAQLKARELKLSFTHLIGWALVKACEEYPSMTHAVVDVDDERHRLDPGTVNLGLAVDVQRKDGSRGLMVPVIKDASEMSFTEFHADYERLVAGARNSKLMPDAYAGATITLTNPGTIGTVASVPRLMKGQGSIIATGAIRTIAGERIMTMTSTYDHRVIQGAESGMFLQLVDRLLSGDRDFYAHIAHSMEVTLDRVEVTKPQVATPAPAPAPSGALDTSMTQMLHHVTAAMSLIRMHRTHGHLAARLDPLGRPPKGDPALNPELLGLTPAVMAAIPAEPLRTYVSGETLAECFPRIQETYCGSMAYEIEHIDDHGERVWLRQVIESGEHRHPLSKAERKELLRELSDVEALESFLHRTYLGHKRFGIEGLDALVPMLRAAIRTASDHGANEVVIGMAHRGRLNVLTHVLGVPYETLLAEFEGGLQVEETLAPRGGTGDVKYHHGAMGDFQVADGKDVSVSIMPNPSHLEAVSPVVEGRTRAAQTNRRTSRSAQDPTRVLPLLIHGDAAFAGQGVVAETFNLSRLEGYSTGGTLHIITNNQVGFTTNPKESRSTEHASDLALGFDIPIFHVNADDPEACIAAIRLAIMYRDKFGVGSVVDLVGYRRHGHNEGDEPRFTQPEAYRLIDAHPTVRSLYSAHLVKSGILTEADADQMFTSRVDELSATLDELKRKTSTVQGSEPDRISAAWIAIGEPETSVPLTRLSALNNVLSRTPEDFALNSKLKRMLDKRGSALVEGGTIDWGHAESLAFGSLLQDGIPVRVTGQDVGRGTFSHRHAVLHDGNNGRPYVPLQNLPEVETAFEIHNSPLSEYACLGFEYGYSVAAPETLVLWEAQFGDFANGAEIIIDQFIIAGLAKWNQTSRLTLLLPHGYEGQGPEHSSARLERFLALGAEGNIRVVNCSTPAQYFHLLRRQAKSDEIRPLIVMTPKSLLRLPAASSPVSRLTDGSFLEVLDEVSPPTDRGSITKLVFCSGKVYYDVVTSSERARAPHVAVSRIEMLYPFPETDVARVIRSYPNLKKIVWLQEEPSNMGARKWVTPKLAKFLGGDIELVYVSRLERSSPAEGYPAAHKAEQNRLITTALA